MLEASQKSEMIESRILSFGPLAWTDGLDVMIYDSPILSQVCDDITIRLFHILGKNQTESNCLRKYRAAQGAAKS
jgi:hypothetical protein